MPKSLLTSAADWFKARQTPIEAWLTDDGGRYAFVVEVNGQRLYVAAKKYLYDGRASFMSKLVERAADSQAYLLLFTEDDKRLLFDAEHCREYGVPSNPKQSKRAAKGEGWLEIPAEDAVDFRAWYDRGREPTRRLADTDDPDRPNRPWDVTAWGDSDV